ncbi:MULTISPECIES: glutamate--cysteine ligase [Thiomicrorhabdus]|uniref:Glutamate--cysteine ligase n=1 Tax=Thiomicrorhabdus heinhorstiae TaxID=2748010 RepID=A0ABS0BY95_9GAMM|nr:MULTISPECIES: glutamate--cysteine ligase [Thiomicrorhabdus]MBF6057816.1 glutamate--cysteine ligase [Thiomicrorhabdus heinhorstiae]
MPSTLQVPHLQTALKGPLVKLERHLLNHHMDIESWFRKQFKNTPAPFYASVDLRNAGYKLAPVDTNLFPAGFNNLHPDLRSLAVLAAQTAVTQICPIADGILIIPENHTRNLFYLENVFALKSILENAGYEVQIGSLIPELDVPLIIELPSGNALTLKPVVRKDNRVGVDDFFPCAVLLNNDLSGGRPEILEDLDQTLLPPLDLGWGDRYKTEHFAHYSDVTEAFAKLIDIDPWLITPTSVACGPVNFKERSGIEDLANSVNRVLQETQDYYNTHDIACKPFVIVKSDSGTYGMAIMSVHSPEDILNLNRKQRNKMSSVKEGLQVEQMLVQEGVYTYETVDGAVAEPVVYMIGSHVIGSFYRVHTGKTATDNLNSPGMHFEPLSYEEAGAIPDENQGPDATPNRFYAYGVIARLALLAAAREIADSKGELPDINAI